MTAISDIDTTTVDRRLKHVMINLPYPCVLLFFCAWLISFLSFCVCMWHVICLVGMIGCRWFQSIHQHMHFLMEPWIVQQLRTFDYVWHVPDDQTYWLVWDKEESCDVVVTVSTSMCHNKAICQKQDYINENSREIKAPKDGNHQEGGERDDISCTMYCIYIVVVCFRVFVKFRFVCLCHNHLLSSHRTKFQIIRSVLSHQPLHQTL